MTRRNDAWTRQRGRRYGRSAATDVPRAEIEKLKSSKFLTVGVDKDRAMGEKLDLPNDDCYFDIAGLARYSGLSVGAIRRYMSDRERPLPHYHVVPTGKERGRVLYSKRDFDAWVRQFGPTKRSNEPADVSWIRRGFGTK